MSKKASFSTIALDSVYEILSLLDMVSLAKSCLSNRFLNQSGAIVAKCIYKYLASFYHFSPFITVPEKTLYAEAIFKFFANKRQEVLIMGGKIGVQTTNNVTKMIVDQDGTISFVASTPMLHPRQSHFAIYNKGEVLSFSSISTSIVERLDTLSQTQSEITEKLTNELYMTTPLMFNNKFLVIGGLYPSQDMQSDIVYELDDHVSQADQGKWRARQARLNIARCGAAGISFEGKIFVCGGSGNGIYWDRLASVEYFDPEIGTWQVENEQMTKSRYNFSLFVYDDELYAVGGDGLTKTTTIEKRNKSTKIWEIVADCGQNRNLCSSVLIDSKIFLFGGEMHRSTWDAFDLQSKRWASNDVPIINNQLPRQIYCSKTVDITRYGKKTWTNVEFTN
jgi:hypothetical protein